MFLTTKWNFNQWCKRKIQSKIRILAEILKMSHIGIKTFENLGRKSVFHAFPTKRFFTYRAQWIRIKKESAGKVWRRFCLSRVFGVFWGPPLKNVENRTSKEFFCEKLLNDESFPNTERVWVLCVAKDNLIRSQNRNKFLFLKR